MRAIRFRGRGRTEASFSCLLAPTLLKKILLMMLGSGMTTVVCSDAQLRVDKISCTGHRRVSWGNGENSMKR